MELFNDRHSPACSTRNFIIVFVLLAAGIAIYSNILLAPFFFDDGIYVLWNAKLHDLSNFLAVPWNRYLTYLTFALNYAVGGNNSFDFHLTNIIIHALNSIFLFYLVVLTINTPFVKKSFDGTAVPPWLVAFAAALVFLTHPVQSQAVSYVTQRFTSLATFFYLSSVLCYARWRAGAPEGANDRRLFYVLSLILGACAQLSKEIGFTLPLMIVLYEFFFFEGAPGGRPVKRLLSIVPFFLLFTIIPFTFLSGASGDAGSGIASKIRGEQLMELATLSRYEYLVTQFRVIVTYLRLFVWPSGLRLIYDYPRFYSFFEPEVVASFILVSAMLGLSVLLYAGSRKKGDGAGVLFSFGIIWFFIALSIESSVIPIKDVIFEHRTYLPNAGLALASAAAVYSLTGSFFKRRGAALAYVTVTVAAIAALSAATYQRNALWGSALEFWEDNFRKSPGSPITGTNLAQVHNGLGHLEESVRYFKHVLKVDPDNIRAHFNIIDPLMRMNRIDEAEAYAARSLVLYPGRVTPYINYGNVSSARGRFREAALLYGKALEIEPANYAAAFNLATAYYNAGDYDMAIAQYGKLLEKEPARADLHFDLAEILLTKKKRTEDAAAHFREALRLDPGNKEAKGHLDRIAAGSRKGK